MKHFLTIIKYDYIQRTRTYSFLITLCASLVIAYIFLPAPNAGYSTIRISDYVGQYNSSWVGYITAILTSVFLSLIGFYLITGSIKTDNETRVGQIISATPITNFTYLLAKASSNFILLLTLVGIIFSMSIGLFFLYGDGFSFELLQFVQPYLIIAVPTMFFISVLAIVFELIFRKYTIVQYTVFFFLFSAMMLYTPKTELQQTLDVFGSKLVTQQLEQTVREIKNADSNELLAIGYIISSNQETKQFQFNGVDFSIFYILSRLALVVFSLMVLFLVSPFFHRFNLRERKGIKKKKTLLEKQPITQDLSIGNLAIISKNYSVWPLFKVEFLMLIRKGKSWLWIFNILGIILLAVLSTDVAHQIVLPVLWFLQVHRFSDITTKETTNRMHYYAFSSYLPIRRLLTSQLSSAVILMLGLTLPLLIRYVIFMNVPSLLSIVLGGVFIVFFAAILGLLTKGKKLFEILFFLLTYANLNKVPLLDYFGGLPKTNLKLVAFSVFVLLLSGGTYLIRKWQLTRGT
ncbi:hypothetical protein ACFQZJ_13195 [Maribacter chungangensis]|uniref:ABC transporter permease n=1 Tax=Maribacter chungangensis TaxID=1069117 RepID=A0ABW3B522_9FLAO